MTIKTNFHTHTTRCLHASGSDEEYILSAIKNGYTVLGFSDHAPYKDNRYGLRMQYEELKDYYNSILTLKEKYKEQIEILIGLEIEYDESVDSYYKELLETFDYLVLGQHVTPCEDGFINNFELTDTKDYILYAQYISKALDTGYFSFLAHPDLVFLNDLPWDSNCDTAVDIIINSAIKNNAILELNANGIRKGLKLHKDGMRYAYPHKKLWDKAKLNNIKCLISADAHEPENLCDESLETAFNLTKEWDLNLVEDFR